MMKTRLYKCVLFLAALVVLQQGIALGSSRFAQLDAQTRLIEENNIDPAAIFYTDSPKALQAEKRVRQQLMTD